MRSSSARLGLLVSLGCAISACSQLPRQDRAPKRPPDVSSVPDAVPREEPRSRYGNPQSYEVFGKTYRVMASANGYKERGVASWYGEKFHGRRTSSGETYDMYRMTAAHKSLPLPTYVRVTHLRNGRSVVVRVNDRGPFAHNRVIDLSYTAAVRLGIIENGTGLVEIEALSGQQQPEKLALQPTPAPAPQQPARDTAITETRPAAAQVRPDVSGDNQGGESRNYSSTSEFIYVQLGAFSDPLNAGDFAAELESRGFTAVNVMAAPQAERMVYRVRIGPLRGVPELDSLTADLDAAGIEQYHLAYE